MDSYSGLDIGTQFNPKQPFPIILQNIIDTSDANIFSVDRSYRYTSYNQAHASGMKTAYGADIQIGQDILSYLTVAEDRVEAKANLDRALAGERFTAPTVSFGLRRALQYFEASCTPIRLEDGSIGGVAVVTTSARKKAVEIENEDLAKFPMENPSEAKFSAIFERAPMAIALSCLPDGVLVDVNLAFEKLFGCQKKEVIGHTSAEVGIAPDPHLREAVLNQVKQNGYAHDVELSYRTQTGSPIALIGNIDLVAIGEESYILNTFVDITERMRAEVVLRQSEERYRSLFETMLNGYAYCQMIFENDEPVDFIYLNVNPAFERLTGLKDVEGKKVSEVIPNIQKTDPELFQIYGRVSRTGQPEEFVTHLDALGIWFAISVYSPANGYFVAIFDNITDRKWAETALRKSQALLNQTQAISKVGGWEYDKATQKVIWTDEVYRIHGVSPKYDPSSPDQDIHFYAQGDQQRIDEAFHRAVEFGEAYDLELRLVNALGQELWVRTVGQVERKGEEIIRVYGNIMDITDRVRAEEALRHSEQLYRAIGESIDYGVWVCDPSGRNIYASPSYLNLVGITQEQCSEFGWGDTLHPDDAERTIEAWKECARTGGKWDIEHRFRGVDGKWHPILARGAPVRNEQGEIVYWAGINLDISGMKAAEEKLKINSERLALINRFDRIISSNLDINSVYDAFVDELKKLLPVDRTSIVRFDEKGENWRILRQWTATEPAFPPDVWNPAQGTALGWVYQNREVFLEEELGEQISWPEHVGLCKEGIRSRVLAPLLIQNQIIGLLTLASRQASAYAQSDVSLLQTLADQMAIAVQNSELYQQAQLTNDELEERVRLRTAELEKANKDLESFSYSVSHDLRAPLRAIDGFAQILARRHREALNDEARHYLDNIVEASERMAVLIDDLLHYSRVGRASVHRQPILLDELFTHLLADLAPRITETQAEIHLPQARTERVILSDPTILGQIFSNIISNALTYHRPNVPPEIRISCQVEADHYLFGVADNGIGIPNEYLEKIFNVFQRLHSSDEYPGTGIGLAIVKKSAELLGGTIWAESIEGQGSTFWIEIPKE